MSVFRGEGQSHLYRLEEFELRRFEPVSKRTRLDEVYVFGRALAAEEFERVASVPRTPATGTARLMSYWPFDQSRPGAQATVPFQGAHGRVLDDALMLDATEVWLTPEPKRVDGEEYFTAFDKAVSLQSGADLADFTLAFDFKPTDSTRQLVLEDELGLFKIRLFETADLSGLQFKLGERDPAWFLPEDISLTPYTGVQLQDYGMLPYVWQRVLVTFDGLDVRIALDDGSGIVRQQKGSINLTLRDSIAAALKAQADKPVRWKVRAEYHFPGTKLAAVEGHTPSAVAEFALIDEVRVWRGAMGADEVGRAMITPRRFQPPAQDLVLHGYFPLRRSGTTTAAEQGGLLDRLIDPAARGSLAVPIEGISGDRVLDDALEVLGGEPVRIKTRDARPSALTLHFDFNPNRGQLVLRGGPFRFECVDGRTTFTIDVGDKTPFVYDPAFGDRIELGRWHKLALSVNAWDASLQVILDGESIGRVPLPGNIVEGLRAADRNPLNWRIEGSRSATGTDEVALVDELIILTPAVGSLDLERLARRVREPGGELAPARIALNTSLGPIDRGRSRLRDSDAVVLEDVIAYYPFDGDAAEASGRGGSALVAPEGEPTSTPTFSDGALEARSSLSAEVEGLDLDAYTIAAWIAPVCGGTTLLTAPGLTLRQSRGMRDLRERIEEAARLGRLGQEEVERALGDDAYAKDLMAKLLGDDSLGLDMFQRQTLASALMFIRVFSGLHEMELVLESVDGRRTVHPVTYALEPKGNMLVTKDDEVTEALVREWLGVGVLPGEWQCLVLSLDVAGGEVRGMLNGRRIESVPLPEGFRLRSPSGSSPRSVGVVASPDHPVVVGLDEVMVLRGAPLLSSRRYGYLSTRPRSGTAPVEWNVQEGELFSGRSYELENGRALMSATGANIREGTWDGIRAMARAVPDSPGRFTLVSPYSSDSGKAWVIVPETGGARVELGEGEPIVWSVAALDGDSGLLTFQCRTPGPWDGAYLTLIPSDDPSDFRGVRAALVRDDPFPWIASW